MADRGLSVVGDLGLKVAIGVGIEKEVRAIVTLGVGVVVVVDVVKVPKLASVIGIVSSILHPDGEIVIIDTPLHHLGIATIWRSHAGDFVVVCGLAGPESGSRWAAEGDGAEMAIVGNALVDDIFLEKEVGRSEQDQKRCSVSS